jgi:hypothetical protein
MKKHAARNLSKEIQQHNRNQAIRLFTEGKKRAEIAQVIGVHYVVVVNGFVLGDEVQLLLFNSKSVVAVQKINAYLQKRRKMCSVIF